MSILVSAKDPPFDLSGESASCPTLAVRKDEQDRMEPVQKKNWPLGADDEAGVKKRNQRVCSSQAFMITRARAEYKFGFKSQQRRR
jgi:hypothetical protein